MATFPLNETNRTMHRGQAHPPGRPHTSPDEWREDARRATELIVSGLRRMQESDPETICEKVLGAADEALGRAPIATMQEPAEIPTGDGEGVATAKVMTAAGVFRLVVNRAGLGRNDPIAAESFLLEVRLTLKSLGL